MLDDKEEEDMLYFFDKNIRFYWIQSNGKSNGERKWRTSVNTREVFSRSCITLIACAHKQTKKTINKRQGIDPIDLIGSNWFNWIPLWSTFNVWSTLIIYKYFRLCLVRVKAFPENIPFSGNAIFRKGKCFYVFGCISKNFPKNIFWCLENATRKKTKLEKQTQHPDWCSRSTGFDGDRRCSTAWSVDRDRREVEITIGSAISRSVDRDLAKHCADHDRREGEFAISDRNRRRWCLRTASTGAWTCERRRLGLCLPLALSLSLSLSLSKIHLKWK